MKNFPYPVYSTHVFGDTMLVYYQKEQQLGFTMIPAAMADQIPEHRKELKDTVACRDLARTSGYPFPAYDFEPLTQLKLAGDCWSLQNAAGLSMRNAGSCERFVLKEQKMTDLTVETVFSAEEGYEMIHTVRFVPTAGMFEINTEFVNNSSEAVKLEYLASFTLGLLSCFQQKDSVGTVHRFLSTWSAECRPEHRSIEEIGLEASWQGAGVRSLRFGQFSSATVRNYYPFLAYEETENQVIWGGSVLAAGPWELELSRRDDFLNLSGGLPPRESNNWCKVIAPGERFSGPSAVAGCVKGDFEDFCTRYREFQNETLDTLPEKDHDFPVVFNEWCCTWGSPGVKQLRPVLQKLPGLGVKYLVLDAGWFAEEGESSAIGDWNEAKSRYPEGLAAFTREIREAGIVPGVWFEFEHANIKSEVYREHPEYFLHLDGKVLRVGNSLCLDFSRKDVWEYLDKKMISMLRDNKFGYMKVDYNVAIAIGSDGPDGEVPAEMLRRHMAHLAAYYDHIRQELPELVIEACASGGHRISPWWARFADMVSGSDAHEGWEIPIVAAHSSLVVPGRALQVWAAVRPDDSADRLYYSLAAACIARMTLSGNPDQLDPAQFRIVREAVDFYRNLVPVLRGGRVTIPHTVTGRWNSPVGWQAVVRETTDAAVAVVHTFEDAPGEIEIEINGNIAKTFLPEGVSAVCSAGKLLLKNLRPFTGCALLLKK